MVEVIIVCILSAIGSAHFGGLADFTTVYNRWNNWFANFMTRGSGARGGIPDWVKSNGLLYSVVKLFWDGRHVAKIVMIGSFLVYIAGSFLEFIILYTVYGGTFYLFYHILLPDDES